MTEIEKLMRAVKSELLAIEIGYGSLDQQRAARQIAERYLKDLLRILQDLQKEVS